MKVTFAILALFSVNLFAGVYSSGIISMSETARTIFQTDENAKEENFAVPFLKNEDPEDSEPDEFLDEASAIDEMEVDSLALAEKSQDTIRVDMLRAAIPLESRRITSPYGFRGYRIHKGLDIGLTRGDSIRAAFDGKVVRVRYERRGYGRYIVLEHQNAGITRTIYAHLSKQLVKVGEEVQAGKVIGLGGNTGRSTGPHLHFEMRVGDMPLDPLGFYDFENHQIRAEKILIPMKRVEAEYAELQKEASKHRFYRVRPGDTLGKIARKYHTTVSRLLKLNGMKRSSVLRVGRMIRCS
ncbi:peptidoglycan DD-metalloendopeptidase family protein [Hallerella porci]|uniref:LysM domain-containing protein n=1 Tax=Hallerella porci TaxID=1945871 RepID=A0ABX5LMR5_9BACT|nr:peptidoglycan DD-metalloendopeptidase family protein [Hallerella porci]PWL03730.1 LysM domain-containing protein [Hallerella porci]